MIIRLKKLIVALFVTARRLNEYIRHYETLSYPVEEVHRSHLRTRRSISRDSTVTLKFRAHGKDFHIRLKRDLTTFSNNLVIEEPAGDRRDNVDISHIYQGNLVGELRDGRNVSSALSSRTLRSFLIFCPLRFPPPFSLSLSLSLSLWEYACAYL